MTTPVIPQGHKYAVLALDINLVSPSLRDRFSLTPDLTLARSFPDVMPPLLRDWLGKKADSFDHGTLFAWCSAPSKTINILDHENKALCDRIYEFYFGLLLVAPFLHHRGAVCLTGANISGELDGRQAQSYDTLPFVGWAPWPQVDEALLQSAAARADSIKTLKVRGAFERLWRTTHAFYGGLTASHFGERVFQFVRAVEGFVLPGKGTAYRDFVARSGLFVGTSRATELGQIYDIRSAIVHMHEAKRYLPQLSDRDRALLLYKRAIQAQALATYCLDRFFSAPALWRLFAEEVPMEQFWMASQQEQRQTWGGPLDLAACLSKFREDLIDDDDLDL